jgi:hypothetical protein
MSDRKKQISVPSLDFTKIKQRRNSDSEINTHHKTLKRKNIDDVIAKHKETCLFIKEIRDRLEILKSNSIFSNESETTHKTIKDILEKISIIESGNEKTPRLVSRCDAMIGNTQLIITTTKKSLDYLKSIDDEAEQHDIVTITMLSDLFKEIHEIKTELKKINEKLSNQI